MKTVFKVLFFAILFAGGCQGPQDSRQNAINTSAAGTTPDREIEKKGTAPKEFVLSSDKYGRDDPFNPVFDRKVESYGKGGLSGIIWDEKDPKAIIDGKIVGVGEKSGANTVVTIEPDRVILSDGSRDFEIRLGR